MSFNSVPQGLPFSVETDGEALANRGVRGPPLHHQYGNLPQCRAPMNSITQLTHDGRCNSLILDSGISCSSFHSDRTDSVTRESLGHVDSLYSGSLSSFHPPNHNQSDHPVGSIRLDSGYDSYSHEHSERLTSTDSLDRKIAGLTIVEQNENLTDLEQDISQDVCINSAFQDPEASPIPTAFMQDEDGDTLCHLALVQNPSIATAIINSASCWKELNKKNELGQSLLHLAIITNQPRMVRMLLIRGASVDTVDRFGNTPLHLACKRGLLDCVQNLTSPIERDEVEMLCYDVPFQRIPQELSTQNFEGETCLQLAANNSHFEIIGHLLDKGADVNGADWKSGRTILHRAVEDNNVQLVEFLLSHHRKPDINARTYAGETSLQLAMGRRYVEIIQLLMLEGAEDCGLPSDSDNEEEDMKIETEDCEDNGYDDFEFDGRAISIL